MLVKESVWQIYCSQNTSKLSIMQTKYYRKQMSLHLTMEKKMKTKKTDIKNEIYVYISIHEVILVSFFLCYLKHCKQKSSKYV